ncbi:hypothetical protein JKF63_05015 [Porcisia hertigi]|uniref:Piwi domain-containing protein n=1 Tax=Porcisia hertigi TaxID=2761500 RepID=A0A836IJA8_9TRYP|nr:hypothetical protein JKF63_05015 [Porcisia hertigi]
MWLRLRSSLVVVSSTTTTATTTAGKGHSCRYPLFGIAPSAFVIDVCLRHYHSGSSRRGTPSEQRSASSALTTNDGSRWNHSRTHASQVPRQRQQQSSQSAAVEKASADRANTRATFWTNSAQHVPAATLKRQHALQRVQDTKSRFIVRNSIREEGVMSNLFPLGFRVADASHQGSHRGAPPPGTHVYVYEVYATRSTAPQRGGRNARVGAVAVSATAGGARESGGLASEEQRIAPARAWRAVQQFLRHRYPAAAAASLPPLARVNSKVYAPVPLPADALVLPKKYFDIGWKAVELRLQRRCRFTDLRPIELQMLLNKIVPQVARAAHSERQKVDTSSVPLEVVREKTGKLVFTMQCVSAGGLRMYRGVLVQAIFVDSSAALNPHEADTQEKRETGEIQAHPPASTETGTGSSTRLPTDADACPINTRHLGETPAGLTDTAVAVHFQVVAFLRSFAYLGTPVESYRIRDASGVYSASLWSPAQPRSLEVGAVYAAAPVRIREFVKRGNARLIELLKGTTLTLISPASTDTAAMSPSNRSSSSSSNSAIPEASRLPGQPSLKIDTKGTIASEASLWEEVLQHFGHGPYDEAAQQRIRKSVQGIPVVISYSLRQGIVGDVRFDSGALLAASIDKRSVAAEDGKGRSVSESPSPDDDNAMTDNQATEHLSTPMLRLREPRLVPLMPHLDSQQPFAVLTDHTMVPLQVLHCCFDPQMRGWQDVSVAVLSIMPQQRAELLESARALLADGLQRWGISLGAEPYRTKALSLLPIHTKRLVPQKQPAAGLARAAAAAFPTTIVVVGVTGPRCTAEQSQSITLAAQRLAQYFRTRLVVTLADERAAVQYVHEQLISTQAAAASPCGQPVPSIKDTNASVILITNSMDTRATRWLKAECMCRGVHLIAIPVPSNPKRLNFVGAQLRRRIETQFELNPLRGVDLRREIPVLGHRHMLIIGVDSCHTNTQSVGAIVGILTTPTGNHLLPYFWKHDARGCEVQHVAKHLRGILEKAMTLCGRVDEVLVFQDGDVLTEIAGVKEVVRTQAPNCGLTYMCLHKRCNVRFMHTSLGRDGSNTTQRHATPAAGKGDNVDGVHRDADRFSRGNSFHNLVKGVVIPSLTPIPLHHKLAATSFYLQAHESAMSTARIVQYTVHHTSPSLDVADVQQIANVMANVLAPQATKLPMSTRCAHRLADQAERLIDAVPQLTADMIPRPLCNRLWFL